MAIRVNMMVAVALLATGLLAASVAVAAFGDGMDPPHWAQKQLKNSGIESWPGDNDGAAYTVSRHIPEYLVEGDFDGDSKMDLALLVRRKADEKFGIAVLLRTQTKAKIIGAGTQFGTGGTDFRWLDSWSARAQDEFPKDALSAWKGGVTKAKRDGIVVAKRGAPKGLIVYDGDKFAWYPLHG